MRFKLIYCLLFIFCCCTNSKYKYIEFMRFETKSFKELPLEVRSMFKELYKYDEFTEDGINIGVKSFICLDSLNSYEIDFVKTKFGPWEDKIELKSINNGVVFNLKYNTPTPIIVFDNRLYISESYNFVTSPNMEKLVFKVYKL